MPIVAALPAIAGGLGAVSAAKGIFNGAGKGPESGMGAPERAVNAGMANQRYGGVKDSLQQQQDFVNALKGANGVGNQSSVFNQLQGVASGTGANPAQAMLNNQTGQNIAQTSALMGSARGVSQNPGMMARQAGNMGAGIQQNAVGQGAALQAQQSLGALGQMGGIAGQQVGNQMAATQGMTASQQASYQQLLDQIKSQNQTAAGLQENINTGNTALGTQGNQQLGQLGGGLMNAAGAGMGGDFGKAIGGANLGGGGGSRSSIVMGGGPSNVMKAAGGMIPQGPRSAIGRAFAKGGKVPAQVSPGEIYLSPAKAKAVAAGKASPMSGERIKGKAKVGGDSYANDTVKKTLKAGGVVIPRSKALGDDVAEKATAFVQAVMARGKHA